MIDYIQTAAGRAHMIALLKRWVPIQYGWMLDELAKPPGSHVSASALGRKESCVVQTVTNGKD